MAYTYDLETTDAGDLAVSRVRLLIPDNQGEDKAIFDDAEIKAFLALENNSVHFAAAQAMDSIASSEARLYKSIEVMDVVVDAVSLAKELRYRADVLRRQGAAKLTWMSIGMDDVMPDPIGRGVTGADG